MALWSLLAQLQIYGSGLRCFGSGKLKCEPYIPLTLLSRQSFRNNTPRFNISTMTRNNLNSFRLSILICILLPVCLGACSEYWWTRGQPPAPSTLLTRAQTNLSSAREEFSQSRADIADISVRYEESMRSMLDSVSKNSPLSETLSNMQSAQKVFAELEGHLSIGSRAAFGELSAQLRKLAHDVSKPDTPTSVQTYDLFAARSFSFLARELATPAPRPTRIAIP